LTGLKRPIESSARGWLFRPGDPPAEREFPGVPPTDRPADTFNWRSGLPAAPARPSGACAPQPLACPADVQTYFYELQEDELIVATGILTVETAIVVGASITVAGREAIVSEVLTLSTGPRLILHRDG
jgi:hypothetical protein